MGKNGIRTLQPTVKLVQDRAPKPLETQNVDSWRAGITSSTQLGYGYRWQKARERYLRLHPLCVMCEEGNGLVVPATVVDHKVAHRGDQRLFWDETNWQGLCKTHHDSHAQRRDHELARVEGLNPHRKDPP